MNNQTENIYNLDAIIKHFEQKSAIIKLLQQHEIAKIKSVGSVRRYKKDENRSGLLIYGKEEETGQTEKILIDFKLGEPCINQVFDAIYEDGKDCSKRIIMFGGVSKNDVENPAAHEFVVESLITGMNPYSLNLYLVKLDCSKLETDLRSMDLVGGFFRGSKYSINTLLTKERFREVEFWNVYYDSLNERYYPGLRAFKRGINGKTEYSCWVFHYALEAKLEWTNDGAFFTVTQVTNKADLLKVFWKARKDELQQLSQNYETRFIYLPGRVHKIISKFWCLPLRYLIRASTEEKITFAELLHSQFSKLVSLIDLKWRDFEDFKQMYEK